MPDHPPKPRLTLRVGITGHRPNKLSAAATDRIRRQMPGVFAAIEEAGRDILAANAEFYAADPPVFRLVSGFAEGADQMVVAACPAAWTVEAILPFPIEEYARDFEQSAAGDGRDVRDEFHASLRRATAITAVALPEGAPRQQGYINAGSYLLRQIDMLIAVWDGQPPQPGGTGAIARQAHQGGIPVVWLEIPPTEREGFDPPPRLIAQFDQAGTPVAPDTDCTDGPLSTALAPIFAAPAATNGDGKPGAARAGLTRFLAERWPTRCYFTFYDFLRRAVLWRWPRFIISYDAFEKRCGDWDAFIKKSPEAENLRERIRAVLLPRFIWADSLAVHYSHLYRSAYVVGYYLSAAAAIVALVGLIFHADHGQVILLLSEFTAISLIMTIVWLGQHRLWHERWLEYRALAETLRHGRFLAFVSEFGGAVHETPGPGTHEASWMAWYFRATVREIGLPAATLDGTFQWHVLEATLEEEIGGRDGQLAYHRSNRDSSHRIDRVLHVAGLCLFGITVFALIIFLAGYTFDYLYVWANKDSKGIGTFLDAAKPFLVVVTVGFSSIGAALAGIRVHGDFEGSSERSAHMVDQLEAHRAEYRSLTARNANLDATGETLIRTARIMSEDLAAWKDLYGRKRLTLG
jgi:hypothetical protein